MLAITMGVQLEIDHPLDPLTESEIERASEILESERDLTGIIQNLRGHQLAVSQRYKR